MSVRASRSEADRAAHETATGEQAADAHGREAAKQGAAAPALVAFPAAESGRADAGPSAAFDARAQAAKLREAFAPKPDPTAQPDSGSQPRPATRAGWKRWTSRLIKTAIGLAIVTVAGWKPVQQMLEVSSTEAVVNARLVTLRAPIDGEVTAVADAPRIGLNADPGVPLLRVVNRRADRSRVDDLRRMISQIEGERPILRARLDQLERLREQLREQTRSFQAGRIRELEARVLEVTSSIAAASAVRAEAVKNAERMAPLAESGTLSKAAWDKVGRDLVVATETEKSLKHRLAAIAVELDALRNGAFVGDSYNDRPSSMQQLDTVAVQIAEVRADLQTRDDRIARLRDELQLESAQYAERAEASIVSPVKGSVWEVLVAPGEEISRGQDLVRLLDCGGVTVTTTVSEAVFNRLQVGDRAFFRFYGESKEYAGSVIRLSGLAAPPDNMAIQPSALLKGAYRVAVRVPEFAASSCVVGRTGKVRFQPSERNLTDTISDALSAR